MAMASPRPIVVGASLSLSGQFAAQGQQAHDGLILWAESRNRAGGLVVVGGEPHRTISLIVYDDASKRADAAAHTRRLIVEDRVDLLFGPYSSVLALAAAEVAAEHDRTLWNHGGSSDAMVGRGWRHVVNLLSPASTYFAPLLDMAVQTASQPIQRVALVYGARGTFPAAVIDGAERHARGLGLNVVLKATYPEVAGRHPSRGVENAPGSAAIPSRCPSRAEISAAPTSGQAFAAPDGQSPRGGADRCAPRGVPQAASRDATGGFGRLARRLGEIRPDVILGAGTTAADIIFARELRAQGVKAAVSGLVAAAVQPFRDALGDEAEGFYGPSQWEPTISDWPDLGPRSVEFAAAFSARFGYEPDYTAAQAYGAGLIAGRCIGLAASVEDHALRAQAATLDMTTFYGRFRTDPFTGQQIGHQVVAMQWRDGRKAVVWPLAAPPRWA